VSAGVSSIFSSIPRETVYTFKRGTHPPLLGVYALQASLKALYPETIMPLVADGMYGEATESFMKSYQGDHKLVADGVAGPITQRSLAVSLRKHADPEEHVPSGIIDGLVSGESGGLIDAKNWSVPGGVDLSYVQRRVIYPVVSPTSVKRAYSPPYQFSLVVDNLVDTQARYLDYSAVQSRTDRREYAWRLAVLEHNWPYGAQHLAEGKPLSNATATWVPKGTKFTDGAPVLTFADWAKFYAMGSRRHNHVGFMVHQAFGVPLDG
jgi:peptidoglycan hydrolase-like protein with peptidoglycan-binding domain